MFGNRFSRFHYLIVLVLAFAPTTLFAQGSARGTLVGTVGDSSGAVVPGVQIAATNLGTGIEQTTSTTGAGHYSIQNLAIGNYRITAQLSGFKQAVIESVQLEVGATLRNDITLEVGEVATEVTVEGSATPLLKTENAEVGHVIEQKRIVDLPLNGRDFQQLVLLTPGSVNVSRTSGLQGGAAVLATNTTLNISNGGRPGTQLFLIDGADATNQHSRTILVPPNIDEIAEFKVSGSNFSAEYGYGTNVINVSTKGGTNDFHGTLWYFNRDNAFKARNYFDRGDVGEYSRDQLGGIIGGPIVRNRTFFSFTYEQQWQEAAKTKRTSVPTALMRSGDLSELGGMIHDPATSRLNAAGLAVRDPFANNTIPQARIHDIPRFFLDPAESWMPLPNGPGIRNNFINQPTNPTPYKQWTIRGDHQLTSKDSIMARYTYKPAFFPFRAGDYEGHSRDPYNPGGISRDTDATSAVFNWTHIFGPSAFMEARFSAGAGHISFNNLAHGGEGSPDWLQEVGIGGFGPGISDTFPSFPHMTFTGFTGLRSAGGFDNSEDTRTVSVNFGLIRGAHTLKFGVAWRNYVERVFPYGVGSGTFNHDGRFTNSAGSGGEGLADYLLGLTSVASRYIPPGAYHPIFINNWFFIQDDWQVSPNLTLNLGLRYEINNPAFQEYGQGASFCPTCRNGQGGIVIPGPESIAPDKFGLHTSTELALPTFQHLLLNAADVGYHTKYLRDPNYLQFAPRFGLAWRIRDDLTVRMGYGIYLLQADGNIETGGSVTIPFIIREFGHINELNATGGPTKDIRTVVSGGSGFSPVTSVTGGDPHFDGNGGFGMVQQWNFTVQKLLPAQFSLEAGYVGTKGDHMHGHRQINNPLPGPGNIQARRPWTQFSGIRWIEQATISRYHAFQAKLERRFSDGLTVLGAFTWSKFIDDLPNASQQLTNSRERRFNRGVSDYNVPVVFVLSAIYELPFFKDSSNSFAKNALGGWTIATILNLQNGLPYTPSWAGNITNNTEGARPIRTCNGTLDNPTIDRWFDTSCFAQPEPFTHGTSGRNILRGDAEENFDLAIYKDFNIKESHRLQFRAEFFNALNHTVFGRPNSRFPTAAVGTVNGAAPARIIQFGLKYNF